MAMSQGGMEYVEPSFADAQPGTPEDEIHGVALLLSSEVRRSPPLHPPPLYNPRNNPTTCPGYGGDGSAGGIQAHRHPGLC